MTDKLQPYNSGGQLDFCRSPARWQHFKENYQSGPRCPMCHSGNVQPFSAIYGFGTTNYLTHKGLFIPHGFSKTRRQSVLAAKCAPPRKMPWWPATIAALIAALFYFSARPLMNIADLLEPAGYAMLLLALFLGVYAAIQNFILYPTRLAAWGRKLFCRQCGASFENRN